MKVIFIQDSLGTGGAERSNANFWYYLRSIGIEPEIIVLKHRKEGVEKEILEANFKVRFIGFHNPVKNAMQIAGILKKQKPDIVHSVLFHSNIRTRLAKCWYRFRHLESLVNLTYDSARLKDPNVTQSKLTVYKWLDRITATFGVNYFHANGETVKRHYMQHLGISKDKITVIPRGRKENPFVGNTELRQKLRSALQLEDHFTFITVGRHEYQKAHDVLLKAIGLLPPAYRSKLRLCIAGREGNYTAVMQDLIQHYQLQNQVLLLQHREDVPQLLSASDCFVFPSRFEGLPGALIEAEAAALPIICSGIDNNLEVVIENKNALVFPLDDVTSLSAAMQKIMDEEKLRKSFSANSLTIFRQRFMQKAIHERMLNLYTKIIHNTV